MKIQEQDRFHGAALTQIVEHKSFKALNRASPKYGHYLVNTDKQVFVKYRKLARSPYIFTVQPDELHALSEAQNAPGEVLLCLVCGTETVCALNEDELDAVIDVFSSASQWVRVEIPKGGSCHVSGSCGKLRRAVTHSSFPDKVFASSRTPR